MFYSDFVTSTEYIRPHSGPSRHALLGVPVKGGTARFTLLHAGSSFWPPEDKGSKNLSERGHSHPVYHLLLYTAGRNVMIHEGQRTPCARGTLVLTNPGTLHEYRPQDPGGASFIELTFDLRHGDTPITRPWNRILSQWFGPPTIQMPSVLEAVPPYLEGLESMIQQAAAALGRAEGRNEAAGAMVMLNILYELISMGASDGGGGRSDAAPAGSGDRLERARLMLERGFAGQITVAELADEACLSSGAFIRAFSARYGAPPMVYRKRLRLNAAKHLLAVSGRSIGEIALNVGYRDIFTFSRTFRLEIGITASEWRRRRGGHPKVPG